MELSRAGNTNGARHRRGVGRDGNERRQERDEEANQDLPSFQSTLVSSFAFTDTFSVFLPSFSCHTSTS